MVNQGKALFTTLESNLSINETQIYYFFRVSSMGLE